MESVEISEIKPRIRESVQRFISQMADDVESEGYLIPKTAVSEMDEYLNTSKEVPVPGELISLYSSRQDEFFRETAEWLIRSGNSFPEREDPHREEDVPQAVIGDPEDLPTKEETVIFSHENAIFNFAGDLLNYIGALEFEDEAFEVAFEREFLSHYKTGLESYQIVIPLLNFAVSDAPNPSKIPIEPGIEIHNRGTYHQVSSIRLEVLDEKTVRSLRTFEYNYRQGNTSDQIHPDQWAIRAEVESSFNGYPRAMTEAPGKQIGKRILTALRLFQPQSGPIGFQRAFEISSGWKEFRLGIPDVLGIDEGRREPSFSREHYSITQAQIKEFQNLWSTLSDEIRLNPEYTMSTSLRRFNEMYVKPYPGDRLMDCMIACEGLLLRGPHPGTKTSRMSLRASMLLDQYSGMDRQEVRKKIKTAYDRRGELVHQDKYLADIINGNPSVDSDSYVHPEDYLTTLRELLANVILAYLDATDTGLSVSEVNKRIDSAVQDAPFSLD